MRPPMRRLGKESPMSTNEREIQAAEWLARLDRGPPGAPALAEFDRWKEADPRNAAAYARLAATWQALDRIQAIRPSADEPIDNDYLAALQHVAPEAVPSLTAEASPESAPGVGPSLPVGPNVSSRRPWLFLAVAASVIIAIASLWIKQTLNGPKTYSTAIGGYQRIVLSDQSTIDLNTDSEVRVALSASLRKVDLVRGEASFEVVHDVNRPFIVSAGSTAIRAVGTKFDVRRLDDSVEVTVDEGKVALGNPVLLERKVDLLSMGIPQVAAGETATESGGGVQLRQISSREMVRKLAWQNQMLMFDGDTLADVVAQFNRYNARQLVITDPRLASLHIGGYFHPTNLDAFISVLQSDFEIRVKSDGRRFLLAAAKSD